MKRLRGFAIAALAAGGGLLLLTPVSAQAWTARWNTAGWDIVTP